MRGAAVLLAAAAAWSLAALPLPIPVCLHLPRLHPAMVAAGVPAAALFAALGVGLGGNWALAAVMGAAGAAGPSIVWQVRAHRTAERAAARWPDFLAGLRGRLSTGEPLPEATESAALSAGEHLAELGRRLGEERNAGRAYCDILRAQRAEWADPLADRVLMTLEAASGIGGDRVGAVLAALSGSVADELRLRSAHEAALTQQRITAAVALAAPWILLLLTTATNPQAAAAYSARPGATVVLIGAGATTAGYWLTRRAARLSKQPRMFT
jgi:tight adherence protein B